MKTNIKLLSFILFALLFIIVTTGCSKKTKTTTASTAATTTTIAPTAATTTTTASTAATTTASEEKVTVAFDANGGSLISGETVQSINKGPDAVAPVFFKDGYTYEFDKSYSSVTSNVTIKALWTAINYTIDYNLESGIENTNPSYYTIETETFNLSTPTKQGYRFNGWYTDNETFENKVTSISVGTKGNLELYPNWQKESYTIYFEENGGSNVTNITKLFGDAVQCPEDPTKTDYLFKGWYTDNRTFLNEYTFSTMPVNGATLYAKW